MRFPDYHFWIPFGIIIALFLYLLLALHFNWLDTVCPSHCRKTVSGFIAQAFGTNGGSEFTLVEFGVTQSPPFIVLTYPLPQRFTYPSLTGQINVSKDEIIALIQELWKKEWQTALAIAYCESGLNPKAIGDPHLNPCSYGIFQIRAFENRPSVEKLFNWEININYAYQLYLKDGWLHWRNCYNQVLSRAVSL